MSGCSFVALINGGGHMSDWKEIKKAHYNSNTVLVGNEGVVDFNPEKKKNVVGAERLTYDEYLDIQWNTSSKARHSFEQCFYEFPMGFKGKIEKKQKTKVCFERIYVEGMYSDGLMFEGKEDHVWMDIKGFEAYEVGDCISFFAEVYRYIKTGNGKAIDFGLRNPEGIKKIDGYQLPTDAQLKKQAVEQLVCETCYLNEQCFGVCLLPKGEKKRKVRNLLSFLK